MNDTTENAAPLLAWIQAQGSGSPAAGCLVVVYSWNPSLIGLLCPLGRAVVRIGRDPENDLVLDDPRVSRFHALLNRRNDTWRLCDNGSTNGVFVAGKPLEGELRLASGDRFEIGGTMLKFIAGSDAEALLFREFERRVLQDGLTGAANRGAMDQALRREIARARRTGAPLALLLIDVDHFKQVNDAHGHAAGDAVLVELVRRLKQRLRVHDELARWGGEEFVVLLPETGAEGAQTVAEDLRSTVENQPFPGALCALAVTISIGAAVLGEGDGDGTALLWRADQGLYAAKKEGRNRVILVSE